MPSYADYEYAARLAEGEDSLINYNTVAAPGAGAAIASVTPTVRGIYEVSVILRITAGANATVTPDNYEIRTGATSKFRIVHNVQAASATQILGPYLVKLRNTGAAQTFTVNAIAAEVAASTIAATLIAKRVGDYFA